VLFLGAGVSASATDEQGQHPMGWQELLVEACRLVPNESAREEIGKMILERRFLLCLQAITQEIDRADYHDFLNKCFNNPGFQAGELHRIIQSLDSRIVVTTNFDKIYDRLCLSSSVEGYKIVSYYTESLGDEIRSDTRLIVKAHGTIDDIQRMVFTKSEYHAAKRGCAEFYSLLKAIFLTHTCIFIGCSLDDPDVLLVLEDIRVTATTQRPHYALVRTAEHSCYAIRDWQDAFNIRALEYGPSHDDLTLDLRELLVRVEDYRRIYTEG
jgi:hypothetical protein